MLIAFITFIVTTVAYVALVVLAFRRVSSHLEAHSEAKKIVIEHVFVPLLWRKPAVVEVSKLEEEVS